MEGSRRGAERGREEGRERDGKGEGEEGTRGTLLKYEVNHNLSFRNSPLLVLFLNYFYLTKELIFILIINYSRE